MNAHRRLEHPLIAPIGIRSLLHLRITRLGIHDAILPSYLLSIPPLVIRLLLPILLQLLREACLQLIDLRAFHVVIFTPHRIGLEKLDLVFDRGVEDLSLRYDGLQLLRGATFGGGEGALVGGGYLADVRGEGADVCFHGFNAGEEIGVGHY